MENTQVDHKVPIILGGSSPTLKRALAQVENLQLLHKQCHKDKTGVERKNLVSLYRRIRLCINNTPIKQMDKRTSELVTCKTLVRLYENHQINEVLHLESNDARRLERMYQMAKKSVKKAEK